MPPVAGPPPVPLADAPQRPAEGRSRAVLLLVGRGLLAIGGLLLIWAALQPWATGTTAGGEPVSYRPTGGLGEGVYMLLGGILVVALALTRPLVAAANRLIQIVPFLVAIVAGLMWLNAVDYARDAIATWQFGGGQGAQTLGLLLAPAGALVIVAASLILEFSRPAEVRAQTRPLVAELGLTRRGVAGVLIATAFALAGGVLGMSMTVLAFGMRGVLPGILLGIFGFLIGVAIGGRVARRLKVTG